MSRRSEYSETTESGCRCSKCCKKKKDSPDLIWKYHYANKKLDQHSFETPLFFIIPICHQEVGSRHPSFDTSDRTPMNYCFNPIDKSVKEIKNLPLIYAKTSCIFVGKHLFVFNGFVELESGDNVCKYDMESDTWEINAFSYLTPPRTESVILKHPYETSRAVQVGGYKRNGEDYLSIVDYDFNTYYHYLYENSPYDSRYNIETGVSAHNGLYLFSKAPYNNLIVWDPRDNANYSQTTDLFFMDTRKNYSVTKNFESIYITGGKCYSNSTANGYFTTDDILELDIRMMRMRYCGQMNVARKMHSTFVYQNELYFLCGQSPNSDDALGIDIYNLKNETWRKSSCIMPENVSVNCCAFNENYFE
uniref:Kelch domain-containing protein 10 n=1 Tax=Parastrongyloides trichosuri TaxID=131310 RepID=A0A0N4Z000_PARTI